MVNLRTPVILTVSGTFVDRCLILCLRPNEALTLIAGPDTSVCVDTRESVTTPHPAGVVNSKHHRANGFKPPEDWRASCRAQTNQSEHF
jgi:hypothetical protein